MNPYTDWTYKLLHDRAVRAAFLAGDLTAAGLPEDLHADFASIDKDELRRSAEKTVAQLHGILKSAFPAVFEVWANLSQEDPTGRELVELYMESDLYERTSNFARGEGDISLALAFPAFLDTLSLT